METYSTDLAVLPELQQLILAFLARCKSPGTLRAYQEDLKNYLHWCDLQQLDPLTVKRAHLDFYRRWMQEQNRWAESTISRRLGTVCGLYKYAAAEEFIIRDPGASVERPGVDRAKQHRTYLTPIQFARLLEAAQATGTTEHAVVALLGMMGLRVGEVCSLNVSSLSIESGYQVLSFTGKGNKAARMPVPIPVMRALADLLNDRYEGPVLRYEGPILLNHNGTRMDRACVNRLLKRLCRQAGLPADISPHSLRRTFATTGLLNKVPIYEIQLAMRHSSAATTAIYDMAKNQLDRSAVHQVSSYMASLAG